MSKQTAVEYLIQYMMNNQYFVGNDLADVFEQAKAMEREQMEQAIDACRHNYKHSDNYYNETYGGEQ